MRKIAIAAACSVMVSACGIPDPFVVDAREDKVVVRADPQVHMQDLEMKAYGACRNHKRKAVHVSSLCITSGCTLVDHIFSCVPFD